MFVFFFTMGFGKQNGPPVQKAVPIEENKYEHYYSSDSILDAHPYTESVVTTRTFDPKFRERYHGEEFDYDTSRPKDSFMSRVLKRVKKMWESLFGKSDPNQVAKNTELLFWILGLIAIAVVLYFLLNYLVNKEGNYIFSKRIKNNSNVQNEDLVEDIHEIHFPEHILKLEKEENYRVAVRYHFLQILKKLNDKNLIQWNPEKTNKEYLAELKNSNTQKDFGELCMIFDYVWYGEFPVDKTQYERMREQFQQLRF